MPLTFNTVKLCIVTINEKPWTRAREVCRALKYNKKLQTLSKIIVVRKTSPISVNSHSSFLKRSLFTKLYAQGFTKTRSVHQ